jgi:iron complex transport system ATP-binding protein
VKQVFDLKDVSLAFETKQILDKVNLEILEKEFVGILGPNGCGKTTLLNLLSGVLQPTTGVIHLFKKPLHTYARREVAKLVSVLPQENQLDFPFTAQEVVLMGRFPYLKNFQWETQADLSIAEEVMVWTDCLEFADRDIRSLSGGERERVLLARALAQQPQILLLDEPTTHLDLKHQQEIYRLLKKLHQEKNLTVIMVVHDLHFAALACERILMLSEKRLAADGPPEQVLASEKIYEVFGANIQSWPDPKTGKRIFIPVL